MDCNIHNANLASVKTSNVREFLFNNIRKVTPGYKYIYLWVSHREYTLDFRTHALIPKRQLEERENFIYEVVFENYMQVINEISEAYEEFQFWDLCFMNTEIKEFRFYDYPNPPRNTHKDGISFFKGVENDVVWIENTNVENVIIDFG